MLGTPLLHVLRAASRSCRRKDNQPGPSLELIAHATRWTIESIVISQSCLSGRSPH